MMLLRKLYNKIFNHSHIRKPKTKNDIGVIESCAITIGVDSQNQYFFEVRWDEDIDHTPDKLANLIIGLNYGFFTDEVCNILKSHEGNELDTYTINNTMDILKQKQKTIQNVITKEKTAEPLVKPSQVFNI